MKDLELTEDLDDAVRCLSIQFFSETEDKQQSIIKEIMEKYNSSKDFSDLVKSCVIHYFSSLIEDTIEPEPSVILGFANLAWASLSFKYSDVISSYVKNSYPVLINYDHPLKYAFNKILGIYAITSKKSDKAEKFWADLWQEGFDYWHGIAFLGLNRQNPQLAASKLEQFYQKYTYSSDKALELIWPHLKNRASFFPILKKGIETKSYWAERLCDIVQKLINDADEKKKFLEETGYKPYTYSGYSGYSGA